MCEGPPNHIVSPRRGDVAMDLLSEVLREVRFESAEALVEQIRLDCDEVRAILG